MSAHAYTEEQLVEQTGLDSTGFHSRLALRFI